MVAVAPGWGDHLWVGMTSQYVISQLGQLRLQSFDSVAWVAGRASSLQKNGVVGCWHGYLSGGWCRLAYDPADATATWVVLEKGPLTDVCVLLDMQIHTHV